MTNISDSMINIISPKHYLRESGAAGRTGTLLKEYINAKRVFILAGNTAYKVCGSALTKSLGGENIEYTVKEYQGFPCEDYCRTAAESALNFKADAIIAAGGGRIMDTAKTAASFAGLPVIALPCIAATCACWAPVAVMYTKDGVYSHYIDHRNAPEIIIADTDILRSAPPEYIRSGIADSLAKWYEVYTSAKNNKSLFFRIDSGFGKLLKDTLEAGSFQSLTENNFDEVIDCIFLLTGLCGSIITISGTQGVAHPMYNAMSHIPELRKRLHGEKVAFALIVQAVLEKQPEPETLHRVKIFNGLKIPLTLEELGFGQDESVQKQVGYIAEKVHTFIPVYPALPSPYKTEELEEAIFSADSLVRNFRKEHDTDEVYPLHKSVLDEISPYIAAASTETIKRKYGLTQLIKLSGNENNYGVPESVKNAVTNILDEVTQYPDTHVGALREALANHLGIQEDELLFANGSFQLLTFCAQAFLEAGHEAVAPKPSFNWYYIASKTAGADVVFVPLNKDYAADLDGILNAITDRTSLLWICNPNNPTGAYFTEHAFEKFIKKVPKHIPVILDEAYIDFAPPDAPRALKLFHVHRNIISLRTFSKVYGLAGLRIGYAVADKNVIEKLSRIRAPVDTNRIAQAAALAALHDEAYYDYVLKENERGKKFYYAELQKLRLRYIPTAANFIMVETGLDSNVVADKFLKAGILIRSGAEFRMNNRVRITIGTEEENKKVISILKELTA